MRQAYLGAITENLDSKRIPLNSAQRETKSKKQLYPYIGANNILCYIDEYIFDEEILCIAEDGGGWGANQICATIYNEKCWVNNHAHVLRAKIDINLAYIKSYLNHANLNSYITGATRGKLTKKFLDSIKVPLPSFDDQIRIATLLSRVETLITSRKDNLRLLDEFLKSTFLEMFGDPVRNEKGWEKRKIKDFAEVKIGPFGSLLHAEDYISNGVPLINPSHIIGGKIVPNTELTLSEDKYRELKSYHLMKNDVVVARRGEIGRCAIVTDNQKLFCGTGSMFIRIQNNYPSVLLHFQIYKTSLCNYLESKAKGVTMKNLNSKVLGDLEVLNPPLTLQNQFAAIVEKVESLKTHYQQNLSELENLYAALSQKAFKGELDLSRVRD